MMMMVVVVVEVGVLGFRFFVVSLFEFASLFEWSVFSSIIDHWLDPLLFKMSLEVIWLDHTFELGFVGTYMNTFLICKPSFLTFILNLYLTLIWIPH
jgi:hypothetical protein